MNNRIAQALSKLFERHRIVFWYDTKKELRSEFEQLALSDIEKIELRNNEYGVKYRILREQPRQKFLLYREGSQPEDLDNWLLDIQLAHGEFRTDQVGIWLAELELGLEFFDLVQEHLEFFQSSKRKEALRKLLKPDDTFGAIRLKMLGVCAASDVRMDAVLESLLQEEAEGISEKIRLIERCGLERFFWEQMTRSYGYNSETPSIKDYYIELFKSCYAMGTDGEVRLANDALVFLRRWKDSRQLETCFETLSESSALALGTEQDLEKRDFRDLIELDYFRLIEQKIVSELLRAVTLDTVPVGDVRLWLRQRRRSHWYVEYRDFYEAIDYAVVFKQLLLEVNVSMDSLADAVLKYSNSWFRIDQAYRKFIYHARKSAQASMMASLLDQIESLYTNNYLLKLGDRFQEYVTNASKWDAFPVLRQREFFLQCVQPFLSKDNKVCVIISDALRYEVGDELLSLILKEDRFSAEIEPMLAMLPSYTQLGMAALLPNKELLISDNESGLVFVDGQNTQGLANRIKLLQSGKDFRATALKAEDIMGMKAENCRALIRDHNVIYVYHNRIDVVGDKRETEERVFEAVKETLSELILLIKKLTGANVNNLLIASDHGFIYQNRAIEESDFAVQDARGEKILFRDRRFVLGKGLSKVDSLHKFTSKQLGLAGEIEVQIPKSINRLRLKGSGSRFVHGGASLQEVVVPVLKINKKRQSDISIVDVEILPGVTSIITSSQLGVILYQTSAVTEKVQPRVLTVGIYTESDELVSDSHQITFDLTSENPREREVPVRFVLSRRAEEFNGQEVVLKLKEQVSATSHYKEYKSLRYVIRRSFTSDFDF